MLDERSSDPDGDPRREPLGVLTLAAIRPAEITLDEVLGAVRDPGTGGIALFAGTVRDDDEGRGVRLLEYSCHPSAETELRRVAERAAALPGVRRLAVLHRIGSLHVGETAVVAAVGAAHRGEAFDACHALVDAVKHEVPLWKHQEFTDGTQEWVGAC